MKEVYHHTLWVNLFWIDATYPCNSITLFKILDYPHKHGQNFDINFYIPINFTGNKITIGQQKTITTISNSSSTNNYHTFTQTQSNYSQSLNGSFCNQNK